MTVLLVVLGCIAAYFLVGVLYARSQYPRLWQQKRAINQRDFPFIDGEFEYTNREAKEAVLWRIPAWPYAMIYDAVRAPLAQWFTKPLTDRLAYAAQLRADARAWENKRYTGTPAEREMAAELARICRERAKEVDL